MKENLQKRKKDTIRKMQIKATIRNHLSELSVSLTNKEKNIETLLVRIGAALPQDPAAAAVATGSLSRK